MTGTEKTNVSSPGPCADGSPENSRGTGSSSVRDHRCPRTVHLSQGVPWGVQKGKGKDGSATVLSEPSLTGTEDRTQMQ